MATLLATLRNQLEQQFPGMQDHAMGTADSNVAKRAADPTGSAEEHVGQRPRIDPGPNVAAPAPQDGNIAAQAPPPEVPAAGPESVSPLSPEERESRTQAAMAEAIKAAAEQHEAELL